MTTRMITLGLVLAFQQGTQTTIQKLNESPTVQFITASVPSHATMQSQTGRIDLLSDAEYASLQKLRQAVADEETRIAKSHGVDFGVNGHIATCGAYDMGHCIGWNNDDVTDRPADRYEYRGQFLLVNVPEKAGTK